MDDSVKKAIAEKFKEVPKVVQDAILSSNVEQHLRELAKKHKLHLDQWITLENEVMMALLGIQPLDELGKNISEEAEISAEAGEAIALDVSDIVFEPIRKKLEEELSQDAAQDAEAPGTAETKTPPRSSLTGPSSQRATIAGDPYREVV